jgi:HTH-type transcriptional regulator/antitoxin HigA
METKMKNTLRPFRPIKPGEMLQEELDSRGWNQADLADIVGRPVQAINEIIAGKKAVTPDTAVALSRALGTSPEYWLNLESAYRLDLLEKGHGGGGEIERRSRLYAKAPVKELIKRRWISARNVRDIDRLEREVCAFLEVPSLDETSTLTMAARKSAPDDPHNLAQLAWGCRVRQIARQIKVARYRRDALEKAVTELPKLSTSSKEMRKLPSILAELGVRFVILEHLPKTRIDGASLWLDNERPVIALTFRYDRIDCFWFTLMHELAHVLSEDAKKNEMLVDNSLVGKDAEPAEYKLNVETKANKLAGEWLIPASRLQRFLVKTLPFISRTEVLSFAADLGVHPAIVVGRLQHAGEVPWSHYRNLLEKIRHVFAGYIAAEK